MTRLRLTPVLLVMLLVPAWTLPAPAQVNTERFRTADGEDGVSGSVELLFSNQTGNTDLLTGGAAVQASWRGAPWMVMLVLDGTVGTRRDETIASQGFAHLRLNRDLTRWLTWEVFVQHGYDRFALLDARTLAGTGPRFTLYRATRSSAFLGLAYMRERERLDVPPSGEFNLYHRFSSYLSLKWHMNDRLALTNTVYYQPRFAQTDDFRLLEMLGLKVGLAGRLSLKIDLTVRHDNDPPTGVKATDTSLSNRLAWDF